MHWDLLPAVCRGTYVSHTSFVQSLGPEMDTLLAKISESAPKYTLWAKSKVLHTVIMKLLNIIHIIHFGKYI